MDLGISELTWLSSEERFSTAWREHPQREHFLSCAPIGHETNFYSYSSHVLAFSVSQHSTQDVVKFIFRCLLNDFMSGYVVR